MENQQDNLITFNGTKWLLLFVFYLQFLVSEVIKMNWSFFSSEAVPQFVLITAVQILAVLLPCVVFMFLNSAKPTEVFKLNKISKSVGFVCVLIGISAQPIASLLNMPMLIHLAKKYGEVPPQTITTPDTALGLLISLLVVALLPAIFEEILMRGIVLYSMEQQGYRATVFISAFLFALLHNNMSGFFGMLFLGVILCYVVWMTQSIFAGMIVHFSFNAFGMLLDYMINKNAAANPWVGGGIFNFILIIMAIFVFGVMTSAINRKTVKRYKTYSFFKKLFFAIFNIPIIFIILGYIMFEFAYRYITP